MQRIRNSCILIVAWPIAIGFILLSLIGVFFELSHKGMLKVLGWYNTRLIIPIREWNRARMK